MKKVLSIVLSLVLIAPIMLPTGISSVAANDSAAGLGYVNIANDKVEIGNDSIKRIIDVSDSKLNTTLIANNRINKDLVPGEDSEDFVINLVSGDQTPEEPTATVNVEIPDAQKPEIQIDRTEWSVTIYDPEGETEDGGQMLDSDDSTYVDFSDGSKAWPYEVVIDLKEEKTIGSFGYQKRPGYQDQVDGVNGTIGKYEIMISSDGENWTDAGSGEFTAGDYNLHTVDNLYNVGDIVYGNLEEAQEARYVKIVGLSGALSNDISFTGAEMYLYEDTLKSTPQEIIDRAGWDVKVADPSGAKKSGAALIDGDNNTIVDFDKGVKEWPYTVTVDMGRVDTIGSFSYQKRPGYQDKAWGINGTLGKFKLQVSTDGETWIEAGESEFTKKEYNLHEEGGLYNVADLVFVSLDQPREARYVRIIQLSGALSDDISFTGAELNIFRDAYRFKFATESNGEGPPEKGSIKASDLKIKQVDEVDYETGKRVQFSFEDYEANNSIWTIKYNVFVEDNSPYLRSNLEISSSNKKVAIDHIDVDKFILPDNVEGLFHHPPLSDISSMFIGKHELVLGQPIYANGMFFGSEFPASDTDVVDDTMQVRYYSGKDFKKLAEDKQLDADGSFTTWNSVMGAAAGTEKDVVQIDLFAYIDEIATKTEFRKQYNSWYDNMLNISEESIADSFYGTEKELSKNGVEPLDSYVVDDGWNAYETANSSGQATGSPYKNQTGFWEFNNKFPDELYTASNMAKNFGSTFGLWLGPQGGYNYYGGFAEFLKMNGTAHVSNTYWKSIDVGSRTYVGNLTKLFLDYQERFDIEYWKLDGFAIRPSTDPDNNHMVGGDNNMYSTSDLWETWIETFETMRQERVDKGRELFLNLTCYVNPSPWLLQWANAVWIQDSGDIGFLNTYGGTQSDQMMSYRDNVYFNIFKKNDFQFPLKNVYNHDPIYGISANIKFTDDDFRNQLMINATRGTAFWELYFSPSIMNDAKWRITADVLDWAERNAKTLEKAKLFGERPDQGGVYGYSAWNGGEGIVSFRNAGNKEQTYTLKLDDTVGVSIELENAKMVQVLPRVDETNAEMKSYGDTIQVTLAPHESRIYQFAVEDKAPAKVISVKHTEKNTVRVKFDQRIQNPIFTVNGERAEGTILEDYRSVDLTTNGQILKKNQVEISVENIWGESTANTEKFLGYENGYAAKLFENTDVVDGKDLKAVHFNGPNMDLFSIKNTAYKFDNQTPLVGTDDFSVSLKLRTSESNQPILKQEGAYSLEIDEQGYLILKVGDDVVHSKATVTTVDKKATGTFGTDRYQPTTTFETIKGKVNDGNLHDVRAVREANGMLKLYVDGELLSSNYVEDKFSLPEGEISIGSKNSNLQVAAVEIKNTAVSYDEAEKTYEDLDLQAGYKELDRTGYQAYANSEEKQAGVNEGAAKNVLDGKESTWWHTQYNGGTPKVPHWITIEMPEVEPVEAYEYVSRNGNGNVKKYQLQVSNTNEDASWETVKSGEMENGGSTLIEFDEPIEAKFYRLYITETYGTPANTFASAAEIKLHKKVGGASDFSELTTAYKEISLVDESLYTQAKLESSGFNALKHKVVSVYENPNSSQHEVDEAVADFTQNFSGILSKLSGELDKSKLALLVAEAEGIQEENYTEESWAAFNIALTNAKEVLAKSTRQVEIDTAFAQLRAALNGLQSKVQSVANLLKLVEEFEQAGEFANSSVARSLNVHLTAVRQYEKKGEADKVVKHLKGFKDLLASFNGKKLISDKAFNDLNVQTDYLINK